MHCKVLAQGEARLTWTPKRNDLIAIIGERNESCRVSWLNCEDMSKSLLYANLNNVIIK